MSSIEEIRNTVKKYRQDAFKEGFAAALNECLKVVNDSESKDRIKQLMNERGCDDTGRIGTGLLD